MSGVDRLNDRQRRLYERVCDILLAHGSLPPPITATVFDGVPSRKLAAQAAVRDARSRATADGWQLGCEDTIADLILLGLLREDLFDADSVSSQESERRTVAAGPSDNERVLRSSARPGEGAAVSETDVKIEFDEIWCDKGDGRQQIVIVDQRRDGRVIFRRIAGVPDYLTRYEITVSREQLFAAFVPTGRFLATPKANPS
jgi:hypothetical protein